MAGLRHGRPLGVDFYIYDRSKGAAGTARNLNDMQLHALMSILSAFDGNKAGGSQQQHTTAASAPAPPTPHLEPGYLAAVFGCQEAADVLKQDT